MTLTCLSGSGDGPWPLSARYSANQRGGLKVGLPLPSWIYLYEYKSEGEQRSKPSEYESEGLSMSLRANRGAAV